MSDTSTTDAPQGGNDNPQPAQQDKPSPTPPQSADSDKRFTQADIDKAITERLAREKKKQDTHAAQVEQAKQEAAEALSERDKLRAGLADALGLKNDDTPPDPAQLQRTISDATNRITSLEQDRDTLRTELDAWRVAVLNDVNPVALMDSRTFAGELAQIDRTQDGYLDAIATAVNKTAEANPSLKSTVQPRTPKPDPTQGAGRPAPTGAERGMAEAARRFGAKPSTS